MKSLAQLFFDQSELHAEKQAIWCNGNELSYKALADLVSKYSNYLKNSGVEYGDYIGVQIYSRIESVALILAAAAIGVGLVPIIPAMPAKSVIDMLRFSKAKHVIATRALLDTLLENGEKEHFKCILCIDGYIEGIDCFEQVDNSSIERPDYSCITGQETLVLSLTSGLHNQYKYIELTQENKLQRITAHIDLYSITQSDRILASTPLYHTLAFRLALLPLIIGGTSILLSDFSPSYWLTVVHEQKVSFSIAVSTQLEQITKLLSSPFAPDISCLRCVVSSSAPLKNYVRIELINKLGCDFHEMYGTSECSTVTSINVVEDDKKPRSVGKAIPNVNIKILAEDKKTAEVGVVGEIVCKTPLLFTGYYGQKEKTEASLTEDGFFKTGDLGYLDNDGYLYFMGRKDDLMIVDGINIYPSNIEECVLNLSAIRECSVFLYPDDRLGEVVSLAVIPMIKEEFDLSMIAEYCKANFSDFQRPRIIFAIDDLPKNQMGKPVKSKIVESILLKGLRGYMI